MKPLRVKPAISVVALAIGLVHVAATLRAQEPQRGIRVEAARHGIIAGLNSRPTVSATSPDGTVRSLRFRDEVSSGEVITVPAGGHVEALWGSIALVTTDGPTKLKLTEDASSRLVAHLLEGSARVAAAGSALGAQGVVTLQTPTATAVTRGGLIQMKVARQPGKNLRSSVSLLGQVLPVSAELPGAAAPSWDESFQVLEGHADLRVTGAGGKSVPLDAGQGLQILGGQPTALSALQGGPAEATWLFAVDEHAGTPAPGTQFLVALQMKQAALLVNAMTDTIDSGRSTASSQAQGALLSTTLGTNLPTLGTNLAAGEAQLLSFLGSPSGPPALVAAAGTSVIEPSNNSGITIELRTVNNVSSSIPGGGGLLAFQDSRLTLDHTIGNGYKNFLAAAAETNLVNTELLLVDSGDPLRAPHQGKAPTQRLIVSGLTGYDFTTTPVTAGGPGRNLLIPVSSLREGGGVPEAVIFTNATTAQGAVSIMSQYASSPLIDPSTPPVGLVTETYGNRLVDARSKFFFLADTESIRADLSQTHQQEGVNAVLQARSATGGQLVTLPSGVVLTNTSVSAAPTFATGGFASNLDGSLMAVIGRNVRDLTSFDNTRLNLTDGLTEPGQDSLPDGITATAGSTFNIARVQLQDRGLAVLNGSTIAPDVQSTRLSLLTIVDGQLTGPTTPPQLLPGDPQPAGVPAGLARADVPPLIEVIDSQTGSSADPNFAVVAQSAVVVQANLALDPLDPALLAASSPIARLIASRMKTTGDFFVASGVNARLNANVPNDRLVLRAAVELNAAQLNVGGHLFNFTGGAQGTVTGNLTALANGSTLNLTGAFINLGLGSSFTLQGGSLVAFGLGTNTVTVAGATCVTCMVRTDIPNLLGIPVAIGQGATINVEPGFVPFNGVGTGTQAVGNQTVAFNNKVNLPTAKGVLVVGQNATLNLGK